MWCPLKVPWNINDEALGGMRMSPRNGPELDSDEDGEWQAELAVNALCAKLSWRYMKLYLYILSFVNTEMLPATKTLPHGWKGSIKSAWSIPLLLMPWQHMLPGHQQPWYWPGSLWIFQPLEGLTHWCLAETEFDIFPSNLNNMFVQCNVPWKPYETSLTRHYVGWGCLLEMVLEIYCDEDGEWQVGMVVIALCAKFLWGNLKIYICIFHHVCSLGGHRWLKSYPMLHDNPFVLHGQYHGSWGKEPGHQQQCYWPWSLETSQLLHQGL